MTTSRLATACWLAAMLLPAGLHGQEEPATAPGALLVFIDCDVRNCDYDHLRREITWVNWVRNREDSDAHILVTSQSTGGSGRRYTFDHIGRSGFAGRDKSLTYTSDPNATDSEVRDGLTAMIALGLVQYVEDTPLASQLRVQHVTSDAAPEARDEEDPWNLWTFRVASDASLEGESQERRYEVDGSFSADRAAEDFKISIGFGAEYSREEFDELNGGESFVNTVVDWETGVYAAWSIDPHWSVGAFAEAEKSTFRNQDVQFATGPALEYNIFPWSESTRRAFTLRYVVEVAYFDYESITVLGETTELLGRQRLEIAADVKQPWGEVYWSVEGIQYFQDLSTHRIETFLNLEYRLFRGFNVDLFASFDRVADQFYLSGEELTEEEILVRRRQRETSYRFDVGLGLSYRFGSPFANVVNPRLD